MVASDALLKAAVEQSIVRARRELREEVGAFRVRIMAATLRRMVDDMATGQYRPRPPAKTGAADVTAIVDGLQRIGLQIEAQLTELALQAMRDPLTNLPNRLYALDRLRQDRARARRSGEAVALLVIDVDDFTVLNNSLGHRVGRAGTGAPTPRLRPGAGLLLCAPSASR